MKKLLALALIAAPALALSQNLHQRWTLNHGPAAATTATVTKAAAAGARHVATGGVVCVSAAATAQTPLQFSLLDGATVLWTVRLAAPVNSTACASLPEVEILGTANTAMTLASAATPVAGAFATVALTGYTTH